MTSAMTTITLDEGRANSLALELAKRLLPPEVIAQMYGLTTDELASLMNEGWFRARLVEASHAWDKDANAPMRVQLKAALAAEETLLDVVGIIRDADATASARIAAHQHLAGLAQMKTRPEKEGSDATEDNRFTIIVNFPSGKRGITVDHEGTEALTQDE